jgi:malate dehydrogenase (oxaloacetate-decarboxylating)(NADP+)
LAREPVPEMVASAYGNKRITFGREYLIPKPLDPRLIARISMAVAKAAVDSGVAGYTIPDWDRYQIALEKRMGRDNRLMRRIRTMVANAPQKRIAFSNGDNVNVIKAAAALATDGLVKPILVGNTEHIHSVCAENHIDPSLLEIIDFASPAERERRERYGKALYEQLHRKGMRLQEAIFRMGMRQWFTLMVVEAGDADGAIVDYSRRYTRALEPVRAIFGAQNKTLGAMQILNTKRGPMFFADTTVNPNPTASELAEITIMASQAVRHFGYEPVIALLSISNFGTDTEPDSEKMAEAVAMLHSSHPELLVDGEMKVDTAIDVNLRREYYPFNKLGDRDVNTFIFPNATSANMTYKMMDMLGDAEMTGPVLLGMWNNVHPQSENASQRQVQSLALIAASNSELTRKQL